VGLVVTGISQSADTAAIEQALRAAGLSLEPLTVYSSGDGPEDRADSGVRFVYTGTDSARNILGRGSELTSFGGTEVPGLGTDSGPEYFPTESISLQLSELEIPDDEVDNYVDAIDAGRSVVAYFAGPDTLAAAEAAFRSSGLANVRTF
jgi:hypothetical protein